MRREFTNIRVLKKKKKKFSTEIERKEIPGRGKMLAQKWIFSTCQNFTPKFKDKSKKLQYSVFHEFTVLFNNDIRIA